jgi:hypothetical protein
VTAFVDKLLLVDTHANPDAQRDNLTPDISVYATDNVPDADAKTDFSKMELFVELKFAETSNPFDDPKDPLQPRAEKFRFENDSNVSQLNRGQLCHTFTRRVHLVILMTWKETGDLPVAPQSFP